MKEKILNLIIIFTIICTKNVYAANYQLKELIKIDNQSTVKGEYFLYKNISYNNNSINIERIINNSYEDKKISISIGLFNNKKINIGTIILCDESNILESKKDILDYKIDIKKEYLGDKYSIKDIEYISVINENETCRKSGYHDYIGKKVEEIGKINTIEKDDKVDLFINIIKIVGIVLLIILIYNFVFTNKYDNVDNDDVRASYNKPKKEIEKELDVPKEQEKQVIEEEPEESISLKDLYK